MDLEELIELIRKTTKSNFIYDPPAAIESQIDVRCSSVSIRKFAGTFSFTQSLGPVGKVAIDQIDYVHRQAYLSVKCGSRERLIKVISERDEREN